MGQHRHHPKASVQLMYNASQFFTTGTEFQCYKCKATVVPTLAGRFMIYGFQALYFICIAIFLANIEQLDTVKQLSRDRLSYTLHWFGILLVFNFLFDILSLLFARFFLPFQEKEK